MVGIVDNLRLESRRHTLFSLTMSKQVSFQKLVIYPLYTAQSLTPLSLFLHCHFTALQNYSSLKMMDGGVLASYDVNAPPTHTHTIAEQ